jgi:hypothetical protein
LEGLGRNPEPFRYARNMDATTSQLLLNAFGIIIGLVILQVVLKQWDKRAKAKEAAAANVAKPVAKKKK